MTKEEIILYAWMDLEIDTPFGFCYNTGYLTCYCINGIEDVFSVFPTIKDKIEFYYCEDDIIKWRPKSLQGIENNNGWTKIESEADLPNIKGGHITFFKKNIITTYPSEDVLEDKKTYLKYSHFRIREKILPPIY